MPSTLLRIVLVLATLAPLAACGGAPSGGGAPTTKYNPETGSTGSGK